MAGNSGKARYCSHSAIEHRRGGNGSGIWRKQVILSITFVALFYLVDSATAFAQKSAAAPAFYLPVGLAIALVLWGGPKYWPLVFVSELLGALFNYHRGLFSWCGIPGVIAVYMFYAVGLFVVRRWFPIDETLRSVADVGHMALIFLISAVPTAIVGALTLLGDRVIDRTAFAKTAIDWWESDAISILTFTPMLLLYVVPAVNAWMNKASEKPHPSTDSPRWPGGNEMRELVAQATVIPTALWLVFRFPAAIPYQPLYLLFIPVIWISVRHGLQGASLATFAINCGAMFLVNANTSDVIGLPRLQLAMLTLALTGLCVGAVVTERRQVEEALERSEFSLSRAQSVARLGSWSLDFKTDELLWSEESYRIFQIPVGTPMSFTSLRKMFHPDDEHAFQTAWNAALVAGTYDFEHRIEIGGVTKWLRGCAEIQRDANAMPVAAIGTVQDVTERRRAEEALREAEEKYRGMFEDAAVGMYQSDPAERLLTVNRALATIFGYDSAEQMLTAVSEMPRASISDRNLREEFSIQLANSGTVRDFEYQVLRADGVQIWVLENAREVHSPDGRTLFVEGAVHDISRRKLLEAQLQQSQKMEAIGRLAGGVAHDFNNALSVIMGYSELVQLGLESDDPLQPKLEEILKAADRAASMTRQLLAFSRKQSIRPVVLDLDVIVADTEKMLRRLIGEDLNFGVLRGSEPKFVRADKGQIEQVLMNLAVNARDAMPRGGSLILETKNVVVNEQSSQHASLKTGRYVLLQVRDNGCGMSKDIQAHIFEPFFTTKEADKGTGLGLSTVYAIVKQSDGHLFVDSEVGIGTTFSVYFPHAGEVPALMAQVSEFANIPSGTETVLLVEDEDSLRTLVHGCLEKRGYSILNARNGQQALKMAHGHQGPIHLLLTDVIMPGVSGRELADSLKHSRPDMKILYMSGYTHGLVTQRGILETGSELLQKPFSINALLIRVRQILDGVGQQKVRSASAPQ